ncbi:hypothetical protein BPNPMPFG_008434 (plasmid) [Mesorhizobium sp. AR07]|uniref:hypothetical protein n=1 Tax=Mesorhizobium sp. AR07 TaxID=2865838 RepID=UPI002160133F|nr:hypothetical protein [Mesorhizobium sp. AR07]UVK49455.1 hypothetical protein BPNPMPFG_008434 [Mesorhizobium sp. AR07]
MGKKAKQKSESPIDRERATEAEYYARKCGLTKEEAARILKDARTLKPLAEMAYAAKR